MRASILLVLLLTGCRQSPSYDVLIRHGMLYDGSGSPPRVGDIGINGDTITTIGDLGSALGTQEIDARGLAVAPGFINMLSWANESLIVDGLSQSHDIQDHATFDKPRQYATGMAHVFVNGIQVLKNGEHTGAKPGRVVRGPGWKGER